MRIEYAIPCKYAEATGALATIVGAGVDTWTVQTLPTEIGLMVAVRVAGASDELIGATLNFHCHVESPTSETVGEVLDQALGPLPPPPVAREAWAVGLFVPIAVRWSAETDGTYMVHLRVEQSEQALPVHVVTAGAPQPGSTPS